MSVLCFLCTFITYVCVCTCLGMCFWVGGGSWQTCFMKVTRGKALLFSSTASLPLEVTRPWETPILNLPPSFSLFLSAPFKRHQIKIIRETFSQSYIHTSWTLRRYRFHFGAFYEWSFSCFPTAIQNWTPMDKRGEIVVYCQRVCVFVSATRAGWRPLVYRPHYVTVLPQRLWQVTPRPSVHLHTQHTHTNTQPSIAAIGWRTLRTII